MISLIYFFVKLFEIIVFFKCGSLIEKKGDKAYWKIALFPIIVFALIEGLRWGHDIDYNVYAVRFTMINSWLTYDERSSPLFTIIVYALKLVGGSYPLFLIIESFFLMFSAFLLLQLYRDRAKWIVPCFLIAFLPNENFIRFYFALAFVICSFYFFLEKKYIRTSILLLGAVSMHFAMFCVIGIYLLIPILMRKRIDPRIVIGFLIVTLFFISVTSLDFLVLISQKLAHIFGNSNNVAVAYLNGMDKIVSGNHGQMGLMHSSSTNTVKQMLIYVPLFWWGFDIIKKYRYGTFVHNISVLNVLVSPIFSQVEILCRMTNICNIFTAIYMGIFMGEFFNKNAPRIRLLFIMLSFFCYFYAYINAPFVRENFQMYFLWNSNGNLTNWAPYYK